MNTEQISQEMLHTYIVFRIKDNLFSIAGLAVQSIQQLPEKLLNVPGAPDYVRGSFKENGEIISVVDMRRFFGWQTSMEAYHEFEAMIAQREKDHVNWVNTLRHCKQSGEPFTLAKDCHSCALGVWRDHYHTDAAAINFLLHKLDSPHEKLHAMADTALQQSEQGTKAIKEMDEELVPEVLKVLENMKETFHEEEFKEMVLILQENHKKQKIALVVDEVLGVESLSEQGVAGTPLTNREKNYVRKVQLRESDGALIMELDVDLLYAGVQLGCEGIE